MEYESAWALGPNSMNDDRDKIVATIDRCNAMGINTIDVGSYGDGDGSHRGGLSG